MRRELSLIALLCLSGVTVGCSNKAEEPVKEVKKEEKKYELTIGKKSEDGYETVIKNETGSAITSLEIKKADENDDQYSENLLANDEKLQNGKEAQWFYTPENKEMNVESKSDKSINLSFDIRIKLEDGKEFVLTTFPFDDIDGTASIYYEDNVGYIKYISAADGKEVSTLEAEKAAKEKRDNATNESSAESNSEEMTNEQPVVSEEPVQQAPVQEVPVYQEPVYQEPVQQEPVYQEPVQQAPVQQVPVEAPSQGSEGCLGGVDLLP